MLETSRYLNLLHDVSFITRVIEDDSENVEDRELLQSLSDTLVQLKLELEKILETSA